MEINQRDLDITLSTNVKRRYRSQVSGNLYHGHKYLNKKLIRNWILGKIIDDGTKNGYELRTYGNLLMERKIEGNFMTRIYNTKSQHKNYNSDYENSIKNKEYVESILGITEDMKINNKYISNLRMSSVCYKNFIKENILFNLDYEELLNASIDVMHNGRLIKEFNDKRFYRLRDWEVTITGGQVITNIIIRKKRG